MLTVFPVYVIDHYQDIGAYKFAFFSGVSTLFLVPGAVLGLVYAVLKPFGGKREKVRAEGGRLSWLAIGMLAYLLFHMLSVLGSGFKEDAWAGVGGWNMGCLLYTSSEVEKPSWRISPVGGGTTAEGISKNYHGGIWKIRYDGLSGAAAPDGACVPYSMV